MNVQPIIDRLARAVESERVQARLAEDLDQPPFTELAEWAESMSTVAEAIDRARDAIESWTYAEGREERADAKAEALDAIDELVTAWNDSPLDLANLAAQHNSLFYQTFMEARGESVAGRNRLAEHATLQLTNEKVECEANIAANEDLCALIRLILEHRRIHG